MNLHKKIITKLVLASIIVFGITFTNFVSVKADTPLTVDISVDGCVSSVNGASSSTANVSAGIVTLTVQNSDTMVDQNIGGSGINEIVYKNSRDSNKPNTKILPIINVTSKTIITFTPIPSNYTNPGIMDTPSCPEGSNVSSSSLILNPVSTPSPTTTTQNTTSTNPNKDKPTSSDDKQVQKSSDKKSTNVNLLPDEKTQNVPEKKESSTVLIVTIIAITTIILGIITYLIKIKKIKLRSYKNIRRNSK